MLKLLSALLLIGYPGLMYFGFELFEPKYLTVIVFAAVLLGRFAGATTPVQTFGGALLIVPVCLYLIVSVISNEEWVVRLYPAVVSFSMAALFISSLFSPMPVIERIARLSEPDFPPEGVRYTRVLTWVWVVFLLTNAMIATWTALWATRETWALYNGVISYICIGMLMVFEYPVRRWYRARYATR